MRYFCFLLLCPLLVWGQFHQEIYRGMHSQNRNTKVQAIEAAFATSDAVLQKYALQEAQSLPLSYQQKLLPSLLSLFEKVKESEGEKDGRRETVLYLLALNAPKAGKVTEVLQEAVERGTKKERRLILLGLALSRKDAAFILPSMLSIYYKVDEDIQAVILDRFASIGVGSEPVLAATKAAIKSKHETLRYKAAFVLGELPEVNVSVVDSLVDKLPDTSALVVEKAAEALGKIFLREGEKFAAKREKVALALSNLAGHSHAEVRIAALLASAYVAPSKRDSALSLLGKELKEEEELPRLHAARAVLLLDPTSRTAIQVLLKLGKSSVQSQAVSFMGNLHLESEDIVDFLKGQIAAPSASLHDRMAALFALAEISKHTKNPPRSFFHTLLQETKEERIREFLEKFLKS